MPAARWAEIREHETGRLFLSQRREDLVARRLNRRYGVAEIAPELWHRQFESVGVGEDRDEHAPIVVRHSDHARRRVPARRRDGNLRSRRRARDRRDARRRCAGAPTLARPRPLWPVPAASENPPLRSPAPCGVPGSIHSACASFQSVQKNLPAPAVAIAGGAKLCVVGLESASSSRTQADASTGLHAPLELEHRFVDGAKALP